MLTITINKTYANLLPKIKLHLSVIGKRATNIQGESFFVDLTTSIKEDKIFYDLIDAASETIVSEISDVCSTYSTVEGVQFIVRNDRWEKGDEELNYKLQIALESAIERYLVNFAIAQFLSSIFPAEHGKSPIYGGPYIEHCAVIMKNIKTLAYLKRPTESAGVSYGEMLNADSEYWDDGKIISLLTIKRNGDTIGAYNGTEDKVVNISVPTKVSDIENDLKFISGIDEDMVIKAIGFTPYNAANLTKQTIVGMLGINDWALAPTKPSYTVSDIVGLGDALKLKYDKSEFSSDFAKEITKYNTGHKFAYNGEGNVLTGFFLSNDGKTLYFQRGTVGGGSGGGSTPTREELASILLGLYADAVHNHEISDIIGLSEMLGKYLRKDQSDETTYKLTMGMSEVKGSAVFDNVAQSNSFVAGAPHAGSGWQINKYGDIEAESLKLRGFMEVPELRFNRASIIAGTNIQSPCGGIIKEVYPDTDGEGNILPSGSAVLELGDDDIAGSIVEGDYCWGYWHDIDTKGNNATEDYDGRDGIINYKGFATVYFYIQEVLNQNSTEFRYELRPDIDDNGNLKYTNHPYVGMHFGGRGNNKEKDRQGFTITTPNYLAIYQLVTGWDWDASSHIVYLQGRLDGFEALSNVAAGTWHNKYGIICGDIYFRGTQYQVNANKRYIYITQSSNGMIDPGETETVTIVIRDNYFRTRTEEFTVKVNGVTQAKADEITLTYAYDNLTDEVNKFTIEATDGTYTLTSAFTIRKNPQRTLSIVTNTDNDPFIDQIEPKHIVCTVKNNLGYDITDKVSKWKITRESSSTDADAIWAQRDKVKQFNGTIDLYWSNDVTINDLDLTQPTTKFNIKATIGNDEVQTTLNI